MIASTSCLLGTLALWTQSPWYGEAQATCWRHLWRGESTASTNFVSCMNESSWKWILQPQLSHLNWYQMEERQAFSALILIWLNILILSFLATERLCTFSLFFKKICIYLSETGLSYGSQDLQIPFQPVNSQLWRVRSHSPSRDRTRVPCIGSPES